MKLILGLAFPCSPHRQHDRLFTLPGFSLSFEMGAISHLECYYIICPENLGNSWNLLLYDEKQPTLPVHQAELVCFAQQYHNSYEGSFRFWELNEPLIYVWWTTYEKAFQFYHFKKIILIIFFSLLKYQCHAYSCLCFHPWRSAGKPDPRSFSLCRALERLAWTMPPISLPWKRFSPIDSRVFFKVFFLLPLLSHSIQMKISKVDGCSVECIQI